VPLADGTPCAVGTCQQGLCAGRFLCDETGINEAIAAGEGPHTFDCDGPTTIVTRSEILIHSEVILDGEANLTLDGDGDHPVFSMSLGVTAELRGFTVTGGKDCGIRIRGPLTIANSIVSGNAGAGVCNGQEAWYDSATIVDSVVSGNDGRGVSNAVSSLSLRNTTVSENRGGGISNYVGTISIRDSTISLNSGDEGGGIYSEAHYTGPDEAHLLTKSPYNSYVAIINSTISGNSAARGGAVFNSDRWADMTMINVTIARNTTSQGSDIYSDSNLVVANTLVDGDCAIDPLGRMASDGYSIESPGDTCGLDGGPDQVNVSAEDLKLGPLADNGGPTMTHALGPGSIAIDRTPAPSCLDTDDERLTEDQRGEPRPETPDSMCDVGAFERQPED
jgi:hypothetical protein